MHCCTVGPCPLTKHEPRHHSSLSRVERAMPREVFVPQEISEAAGFLPAEAKVYSR